MAQLLPLFSKPYRWRHNGRYPASVIPGEGLLSQIWDKEWQEIRFPGSVSGAELAQTAYNQLILMVNPRRKH